MVCLCVWMYVYARVYRYVCVRVSLPMLTAGQVISRLSNTGPDLTTICIALHHVILL